MTTNEPRFWAVLFIGPPGSGKDTQADLLAEELGLTHVQTSKLLEEKFKNAGPDDTEVEEEKRRFMSGELNSPGFVFSLIKEAIINAQRAHAGVVFSGSPREVSEAKSEMPILETVYGRNNIHVINIKISEAASVARNSSRRICEKNRHPIPDTEANRDLKTCPEDGSPIIIRQLDDPKIISHRYEVYLKETAPVLDFLSKEGYNIIQINGEQSIEDVHRDILNHLW